MNQRVENFTRDLEALFHKHKMGISVENDGATLCDLTVPGHENDAIVKLCGWCEPADFNKFPNVKHINVNLDKTRGD